MTISLRPKSPTAAVVQFGGQTAIKLAKHMDEIGLPILGTPADAIDEAEDRERFDELLERCGIPRPEGRTVFTLDEALQAAQEVGYPVLMRPSYVLGGQNMIVAYNSSDVIEYMGVITKHVDMSHPVLMDKYILGTECEVDAICDGDGLPRARHHAAGRAYRRSLRRLHLCLPAHDLQPEGH